MSYAENYSATKTQNLSTAGSFVNYISEIRLINKALGIDGKDVLLSYNPGLALWNRRQLSSESEIPKWQEYEKFQVETALRERNHAAKSAITYNLDNNNLAYNPLFPEEPFINVLQRGFAYRAENGSKELEREQAEIDGWERVMTTLSDPNTPQHTKAILISGPGIVDGSTYQDNFVDVYQAVDDPITKKRRIEMVRHASSLSYEQYGQKVKTLGQTETPNGNEPIDAWYLSHPIFKNPGEFDSAGEIFHHLFECKRKLMTEEEFQKVLQMTMPVINYYLSILSKNTFDPEEIAVSWNAVLNKNDDSVELLQDIKKASELFGHKSIQVMPQSLYADIRQEVNALGRRVVMQIPAGCGNSSGLKTKSDGLNSNPVQSFMENSVGKFDITNSSDFLKTSDKNKDGWVNECGHLIPWEDENLNDPEKWRTVCPDCGAKLVKCK